ncbi:MAG TPA: UvrD-helicase domain-containing protein, partial [Polyangia bacterium]
MSVVRVERPAVLAGLPLGRHAVIEASAGTGKTFTLEHLIVEVLLTTDTRIDEILVVTFTERATSELRLRVREKLRALLAAGPAEHRPDLPAERAWDLDDAARERLRRALHGFDGATIATIHAFCQRILVEHAFPNRRLFAQELIDGREAFGRAFRAALREQLARDPEDRRWLRAALAAPDGLAALERGLYACHRER